MNRTTKINILAYASEPDKNYKYEGDIVDYKGKRYFVSLAEERVEFIGIIKEEFAELTQAISKQIRGYDNRIGLLEEMADAYICLEFLKSIFNITPEELQKAMDVKLQRERNKQR